MKIIEAQHRDIPRVRELFEQYQNWLDVSLCFQGFAEELATLPGLYSPPRGAIWLAFDRDEAIGCVGIRPRSDKEAELKRLFVQPDWHGLGIGRQLFHTAMTRAENIGFASVVLDTLPNMYRAKSLYLAYGFKPIPAYYDTPADGTVFFRYTCNPPSP